MKRHLTEILSVFVHLLFITTTPEQNGRQFANHSLMCISFKENDIMFIQISLNFVPEGQIDRIGIGSDNGMALNRLQVTSWTNDDWLWAAPMR